MKLLLFGGGLSLLAIDALPQKVSGGELFRDTLPPTTVVASSPPEGSPPPSTSTATVKSAAEPKPSIIWHRVHGRWQWHCVAHCSELRGHPKSPGEDGTEFDDFDTN
jgi:hypothetical protein